MNNGYTTIQIGSNPVGIKFDYLAVKLFTKASADKIDIYFTETAEGQSLTIFGIAKLLHTAYISNCERKEVKPEIDFEPFVDWVEQLNDSDKPEDQAELARVLTLYAESSYSKKLMAVNEEKKSQLAETSP